MYLSSDRRQVVIWTNEGLLLSIGPFGTSSSDFESKYDKFHSFEFENAVCRMATILSRPQRVNQTQLTLIQSNTHTKIFCMRQYHPPSISNWDVKSAIVKYTTQPRPLLMLVIWCLTKFSSKWLLFLVALTRLAYSRRAIPIGSLPCRDQLYPSSQKVPSAWLAIAYMSQNSNARYKSAFRVGYRTEVEAKWPPFCRRHIWIHFLERNFPYLDLNFPEMCSQQ